MTAKTKDEAGYAAEIIAHLARLAHANDRVAGLSSAQQTALRFFGKASRLSRTLSAFANYHATTRGSASQTVNSLVARGFLTRIPSEQDRRSARFELTEKGRRLSDANPFENLVRTIAALPRNHEVNLAAILENVLACVGEGPHGQYLGTCSTCQYLKECCDQKRAGTAYFCVRAGAELSGSELHDICMYHRPKRSAVG